MFSLLLAISSLVPTTVAFAQNETVANESFLPESNETSEENNTSSFEGENSTDAIEPYVDNNSSEYLPQDAVPEDVNGNDEINLTLQQEETEALGNETTAPGTEEGGEESPKPVVSMRGRGHNLGKSWDAWQTGSLGEVVRLGKVGSSATIKEFKLKITNTVYSGGVRYQVYTPKNGWLPYSKDGAKAAAKGKPCRIEALRASLTGKLRNHYDLWYRVYVSGLGWLSWTCNNKAAGTRGFSRSVEAIEFTVREKGKDQPTGSDKYEAALITFQPKMITSRAYIKKGWVAEKQSPKVSGSTKRSLTMKAVQAKINKKGILPGSLSYRIFAGGSWSSWLKDGEVAGNKKTGIEAMGFKLTGSYKKLYDIYYRVHVAHEGWLGWAKNGQKAGSTNAQHGLDGFQIKLVPKGAEAPGSSKNHFVKKSFFLDAMSKLAQGFSSPTNWLIMVDNGSSKVGIYNGSKGNWKRTHYFSASMGKSSTPTVRGTFSVSDRGYVFGDGYSCYYWTRFHGDYLFHSVLYHPGTFNIMDGSLGYNVSHGCVRMAIENARFIHDNIPYGTTVYSY